MIAKYSIAWLGLVVLAIMNGSLRDGVYFEGLGDNRAHQVSTQNQKGGLSQ